MAKMEITPEMMNSIAKELGKKVEEWNNSVKSIYTTYAELDAEFDGDANNRFNARMAADQPKYNALAENMTAYINEIIKASAGYVEADIQAANTIK